MNKAGIPGRRDLHSSEERAAALRRLSRAVVVRQRAHREFYAALVQAHVVGVRWRALEIATGISEDTLHTRVRQLRNGIPEGFMWRI
jgi:hypothetical protein